MNGEDTRAYNFYMSGYALKKQGRQYNLSALLARELA